MPTDLSAPSGIDSAARLLDEARRCVGDAVDVSGLVTAAMRMEELLAKCDAEHRAHVAEICHELIDLARDQRVRKAAYDTPAGTMWIDAVLRLIDHSDFTVGKLFAQRVKMWPDRTLLVDPRGDDAVEYSIQEVSDRLEGIARGIRACCPDGPRVALFAQNRVEGALFDLACLVHNIFITIVPAVSAEDQLEHILRESSARMIAVAGSAQLAGAQAVFERVTSLEWLVTLDGDKPSAPAGQCLTLADLAHMGASFLAVQTHDALCHSRDTITTMYTSGTTGRPKGIQFTHLNIVSKRYARAAALPDMNEDEVFVCFLPLYHTFGRWLELMGCVHLGGKYVFAESAVTESLVRTMQRFRPTAFISVPKKWTDLYTHACGGTEPPDDPRELGDRLREITGGRLRWGLSAAGRLDPSVFRAFQLNGIDLLSGYGMTEATGGITMTPPGGYVPESIGKALPGIEIGLGSDDELKLRGPYVTPGYTNAADNLEAIRDGWLFTGDIVSIDPLGFLRHVDRKKDIYKNAGGRTIAPQRIESLYADFPEVHQVFAVGDGREYVTLLIRPNFEAAEIDLAGMSASDREEYFRDLVASCNRFLAPFERVVRFVLIDRDFSVERKELTAKGSYRRPVVEANFRDVIDPMYRGHSIDRTVNGVSVRVPASLLQHLGATEAGTRASADGLEIKAIEKCLHVRRDAHAFDRVWIGNLCYELREASVEIEQWLRRPDLWLGNAELTDLTGEEILFWSVAAGDRDAPARLVGRRAPHVDISDWRRRLEEAAGRDPTLLTIHAAAVCLCGDDVEAALAAVDHLGFVVHAGSERFVELAEYQLQACADHGELRVRARAFAALMESQSPRHFESTVKRYCEGRRGFMTEESADEIAESPPSKAHWGAILNVLARLRMDAATRNDPAVVSMVSDLFDRFVDLGSRNPDFFELLRRELISWWISEADANLREKAWDAIVAIRSAFREHVGKSARSTIDPDTGQKMTWGDTLEFDEGLDAQHVDRIASAIQNTDLVREALYLFYRKRIVDLDELMPGSIWISLIDTRFGRSVYRCHVRVRNGERFSFAMFVLGDATMEAFQNGLALMCVASTRPGEPRLAPQLGGYWPEYALATAEYIRAEPVDVLVRQMQEHPDRDVRQRLRGAWRHLCWSALTAAIEFYRRTEYRWTLTSSVAREVSVPLADYDFRTRIASVAGWRRYRGPLDLLLRLRHDFLDRLAFRFTVFERNLTVDMLFDAVLECLGQGPGIDMLKQAIVQSDAVPSATDQMLSLRDAMRSYVERIEQVGYMPRALFFAIARYRAWIAQVPDATTLARAGQLRELIAVYQIEHAIRKFPGSRLWLYADTVLADVPAPARAIIDHAIRQLRGGARIRDVLGGLYSQLRSKLESEDHRYFLARAAYPHLDLEEQADLVAIARVGVDRAELETTHIDKMGKRVRIRPPANSRELDTLHRIYYTSGISSTMTEFDQFLVAVSEGDSVLGGLSFVARSPAHASLEKVAIASRTRGCGLGRLLVEEFLRRQRAEGVRIVSALLIRADWLNQFGFRSHPRYPGVVLPFDEPSQPTQPADVHAPAGIMED